MNDDPVVKTSHDVKERNQRACNYQGWNSNKIPTNIKDGGRTSRLHDFRTFTEGRNNNGWPVACVEQVVSYCRNVKYRGRKITLLFI